MEKLYNFTKVDRNKYYEQVRKYFDEDAHDYIERYEKNYILKRMREDFRRITERYEFQTALEIGCGPGMDLIYFAMKFPQRKFYALDISPRMVEIAKKLTKGLDNVFVEVGTLEDVSKIFNNVKFDMVYSYFGALNTVFSLQEFSERLYNVMKEDGHAVFSVINKYYMFDVLFNILRFKFDKAFERVKGNFQGYSPKRKLHSKPLSYNDVKKNFRKFKIIYRKGYSITYPAWYRASKFNPKLVEPLWKLDQLLNKTPLWQLGEYALYVLKPV